MEPDVSNKLSTRQGIHFALERARGIPIITDLARYGATLRAIKRFDFRLLTDTALTARAAALREHARASSDEARVSGNGANDPLRALLPEAYALTRECVRRELGCDAYDVQLIAAIALHEGRLVQMRTGEGKTLTVSFAVFLNALTGRGVHVMTANDYLARRDALWMGPVYRRLGLTVAHLSDRMGIAARRKAYRADVTYLTAKQGGFDYLSDQLQHDRADLIRREPHLAIIDEADFILVDEARIPLVIASEGETADYDPHKIGEIVELLAPDQDYSVDREGRNCCLTLAGQRRVQELLGCGGMHEESSLHLYAAVHVGLLARRLLRRDVDYIVRDGRIEIVDELTGRIADKRRWPYGIQTALEVKEALPVRPEGRIRGSLTIQDFIGLYPRLAALTATAVSAAQELYQQYGLSTVLIPPNRPERALHAPDRLFATREAKLNALVREIHAAHATGRPVLVGTRTIRESEELARCLRRGGLQCSVLNAKNDRREARLVARAGERGAVTIATNMAGRGTDIRLGGPDGAGREGVERLGGLYVIGTNRHESVRIDDQLRGRAGRQGDPGLTRFFVSLEDDLMERYGVRDFLPKRMRAGAAGGEILDRHADREIARAQRIIEHQHSEMRRTLRNYTRIVEAERRVVEKLRREALCEDLLPQPLVRLCAARREEFARETESGTADALLTELFLSTIDSFWTEHLSYVEDLREGIHLQRYGHREPLLVYIEQADAFFRSGLEEVYQETARRFRESCTSNADRRAARRPASTWTYLVNDDPFPGFTLGMLGGAGMAGAAAAAMQLAVVAPLLLVGWCVKRGGHLVSRVVGECRRRVKKRRKAS